MSLESNKETVRHTFRAVESGQLDNCNSYIDGEYTNLEAKKGMEHEEDWPEKGPDEFRRTAEWLRSAFSDLKFEEKGIVAEGDWVVIRVVESGRHTGQFFHVPASGREFTQDQTHWFRVRDGKVIEHFAFRDDLGLMKQLGGLGRS